MNHRSDLIICAWNSQVGSSPHQAQSQSDVSNVACAQQVEDIGPFLRLLLYLFSLSYTKFHVTKHIVAFYFWSTIQANVE